MMDQIVNETILKIKQDGHTLLTTERAKNNNMLIVYSPYFEKESIYAKIINLEGTVTHDFEDIKLYTHYNKYDHTYRILNINIHGNKINKGYGSILIKQLIKCADSQLIYHIEGYMRLAEGEDDQRLRYFYRKHGFLIDSRRNILWKSKIVKVVIRKRYE